MPPTKKTKRGRKPKNLPLLRDDATVEPWEPRQCTCAYLAGVPHTVYSRRTWHDHKARSLRLKTGGGTLSQLERMIVPSVDDLHEDAPGLSNEFINYDSPGDDLEETNEPNATGSEYSDLIKEMERIDMETRAEPPVLHLNAGQMKDGFIELDDNDDEDDLQVALEKPPETPFPPVNSHQATVEDNPDEDNDPDEDNNEESDSEIRGMETRLGIDNPSFWYGPPGFPYSQPEAWTERDILSFLLYDIKSRHNVRRAAHEAYLNLIRQISSAEPFSLPKTFERLTEISGIRHVSYGCCINSCMAFTEDINATECSICFQPRYHPRTQKDRKTFEYIPLIHRLRLQYANPYRAKVLVEYVQSLGTLGENGYRRDIWNGSHMTELRRYKGLFNSPTDLAFGFSCDGANLFKMRGNFSVWPLLLINFNLPPEDRVKQENVLLLGVIPGPSQEKININSFLRPMIDEFKILEAGVPNVFNAASNLVNQDKFTLKAHLITISGDTPARDKLCAVTGSNSYHYCLYCDAWGIHNGAIRYELDVSITWMFLLSILNNVGTQMPFHSP